MKSMIRQYNESSGLLPNLKSKNGENFKPRQYKHGLKIKSVYYSRVNNL